MYANLKRPHLVLKVTAPRIETLKAKSKAERLKVFASSFYHRFLFVNVTSVVTDSI